jgi:hypothetical protein
VMVEWLFSCTDMEFQHGGISPCGVLGARE